MEKALPAIPAQTLLHDRRSQRFVWREAVCAAVLEQEFTQLKPMKRRGNRRYYQHHEVLLIRRIRDLLYEQGFTISGARNRLSDGHGAPPNSPVPYEMDVEADEVIDVAAMLALKPDGASSAEAAQSESALVSFVQIHAELVALRDLLTE